MQVNLPLNNVSTEDQFSPLPAGEYNAVIIETDVKRTRDGSGTYIAAKFEIIDGQYAKRTIFHNFNIANQNAQAVEIGLRQVKQVASFGGHRNPDQISDTNELHGLPVAIVVIVRPPEGQYQARNEIKGFKKPFGAGPSGVKPAQAAAAYAANAPASVVNAPANNAAQAYNPSAAQSAPSTNLQQQAAAAAMPPWAR